MCQVTFVVPLASVAFVTLPPVILIPDTIYCIPAGKKSVIFIPVALLNPSLVTIIVKLTRSPTCAVLFSIVFTTVRLTCGLIVMFVPLPVVVLFSVELTTATFSIVPFVNTLT